MNANTLPTASPHEAFLGVLMLDTRFERLLGDIGHPNSFGVPTRAVVLKGAWPEKVVQSAANMRAQKLVEPFKRMVRQLVADGASAITTSCGFLVLLQADLQAAAGSVPVVSSALMHLPRLLAEHSGVGVLTIDAKSLGTEHLRSAGVRRDDLARVKLQGMPRSGEFASKILANVPQRDHARAEQELIDAALALRAKHPDLTDLVLECTNMPPHAAAIEAATGLRTWSLLQSQALLKPFQAAG
jgi:hypothetical protein